MMMSKLKLTMGANSHSYRLLALMIYKMKEIIFFVPINEIAVFAETALKNALCAVICGTAYKEVVFSVKYNPVNEKQSIIDMKSSLNMGYWVDDTYK